MKNNYFHILVPYWGAWVKYNWAKNDYGVGLDKEKIDILAKDNQTVIVRIGKHKQEYTIKATAVQTYPLERIKDYYKLVYIVQRSALNYRKVKTEETPQSTEELSRLGVFG